MFHGAKQCYYYYIVEPQTIPTGLLTHITIALVTDSSEICIVRECPLRYVGLLVGQVM